MIIDDNIKTEIGNALLNIRQVGRPRELLQKRQEICLVMIFSCILVNVLRCIRIMVFFCYSASISALGKLKNKPDHAGNLTYDLWNTSPMLCQLSYMRLGRFQYVIFRNLVSSISMQS